MSTMSEPTEPSSASSTTASDTADVSPAELTQLIDGCLSALTKAYCPYSKFYVGSAVLTDDGKLYTGCNVENSSYGLSVCAERVAIFKAVSEGHRKFKAISVATNVSTDFSASCGACRQIMVEFGVDWPLYLVRRDRTYKKIQVTDLLPLAFTPQDLQEKRTDV